MAWVLPIILEYLPHILIAIGMGLGLWFFAQSGSAIVGGIQQAAPGLGTAVGSIGMMFSLLPVMFMMMMFMWLMTSMLRIFE